MSSSPPYELSAVLVATGAFRRIRRTVAALAEQSIADRIELVLVVPSEKAIEPDPAALEAFGGVRILPVGPITSVDHASARGILAATAGIIAVIEDHAFPEAGWAEAVVRAFEGPCDAATPRIRNANPGTALSWGNMLIAYGPFTLPAGAGPAGRMAQHNIALRSSAVAALGDDLGALLTRGGGLAERLSENGARLRFVPDAVVAHVNPSSLRATARLRFSAGRGYGARRREGESWSPFRRLLVSLAAPAIPAVRMRRIERELFAHHRDELRWRKRAGVFVGLCLETAGEVAGYLVGPGRSADVLADFEMDRWSHLSRDDRSRFADLRA